MTGVIPIWGRQRCTNPPCFILVFPLNHGSSYGGFVRSHTLEQRESKEWTFKRHKLGKPLYRINIRPKAISYDAQGNPS